MPSLVISLQEEALAPDVPVTRLLTKAKAIAAKLGLAATTEWIASELGGYSDVEEVPEYRVIYGNLVYRNLVYGWLPIQPGDEEAEQMFGQRPVTIPVSQMEALVASAGPDKQDVMIGVSAGLANQLRKEIRLNCEIAYHANISQVVRILDAVRQRVLDWALKLETDGILGEGLSFSQDEKARVTQGGDTYNITAHNVVASMGHVSEHASVTVTQTNQGINAEQLQALLQSLRQTLGDSEFKGREYVDENLADLQKEAASSAPRKKNVFQYLAAVRGILGKAIDFVGKTAAEHEIDQYLDSLMP